MSEYVVNGEVLGAFDYALRGMPPMDDQIVTRKLGLEPYIPSRPIPLSCAICGGDAGMGGCDGTATDEEYAQAVAEYNATPHLCIRHHADWRFGRLPDYPVFPHPKPINKRD